MPVAVTAILIFWTLFLPAHRRPAADSSKRFPFARQLRFPRRYAPESAAKTGNRPPPLVAFRQGTRLLSQRLYLGGLRLQFLDATPDAFKDLREVRRLTFQSVDFLLGCHGRSRCRRVRCCRPGGTCRPPAQANRRPCGETPHRVPPAAATATTAPSAPTPDASPVNAVGKSRHSIARTVAGCASRHCPQP